MYPCFERHTLTIPPHDCDALDIVLAASRHPNEALVIELRAELALARSELEKKERLAWSLNVRLDQVLTSGPYKTKQVLRPTLEYVHVRKGLTYSSISPYRTRSDFPFPESSSGVGTFVCASRSPHGSSKHLLKIKLVVIFS